MKFTKQPEQLTYLAKYNTHHRTSAYSTIRLLMFPIGFYHLL